MEKRGRLSHDCATPVSPPARQRLRPDEASPPDESIPRLRPCIRRRPPRVLPYRAFQAPVLTLDICRREGIRTYLRKKWMSEHIIPDHIFVFAPNHPCIPTTHRHPTNERTAAAGSRGRSSLPGRTRTAAPPEGRFRPLRIPAHPPSAKSVAEPAQGGPGAAHSRRCSTLTSSRNIPRHPTTSTTTTTLYFT